MKKEEELEFQRKVVLVIKVIFFGVLNILFWGWILWMIITILIGGNLYPIGDDLNSALIEIVILGILYITIAPKIKEWWNKRK